MGVKLTGSEFNEFMKDDSVWLKDYWYEDVYALVNGEPDELEAELPDDAKVVLEGGCFYTGQEINSTHFDFEQIVRKWLKARVTAVLVVEVPKDKLDEAKALFKSKGYKVK